jgi:hypothetical protein
MSRFPKQVISGTGVSSTGVLRECHAGQHHSADMSCRWPGRRSHLYVFVRSRKRLPDQLAARADEPPQVEHLRKDLVETEHELQRVRAAEQMVAQMLAVHDSDDGDDGGEEEAQAADEVDPVYSVALSRERAAVLPPGGRLTPYRREAGAPALPADDQALPAVVGVADGRLPCKPVCLRAGLGTGPGQVEGARAKLQRLEVRGWLRRTATGAFA